MDDIDIIKSIDIFRGLTDNTLELICNISKLKNVKKKTLIFSKGEENHSMYMIKNGDVDVFILTESGRELILSSLKMGDYFGELSLLDESVISTNIIATNDCELLVIYKDDFFKIMNEAPEITLNVIRHLCAKVRSLTDKVESFALLDVYHRFSLLLNDLSIVNKDDETVVSRSLTHKNIALRIGSSREMVSRIMKDLEKGSYISIDNKVITIKKKLPLAW